MFHALSKLNRLQLLILALMLVGVAVQLYFIVAGPPLVAVFLAMPIALGGMTVAFLGQKTKGDKELSDRLEGQDEN
ncbi:MAG: hypothetical protein AAFQ84_08730 [Pseudomonadota bacterium]